MLERSKRKRDRREAARRREAVRLLLLAEAGAGYAARQVSDGLGPAEARDAVLQAAAELELAAGALRQAVQLRPADRRVLAGLMASNGVGTREIAATVGVTPRTVRKYLHRPEKARLKLCSCASCLARRGAVRRAGR